MYNNIKNKLQKNTLLFYKLAYDMLFILISFFMLTLLAESLLPGIVSSRIGSYAIVMLICANLLLIFSFKKHDSDDNQSFIFSKKILSSVFVVIILFIFNALLGLPIMLNVTILLLASAMIYFMYQIFLEEE